MRLFFISMIAWTLSCCLQANARTLTVEDGLSNNYVRTIFKDSKGLMWFGTETGLDSYDGVRITNYAKRLKTPLKGAVQSIAELEDGVLLVGTSWGAFNYSVRKNQVDPIDFDLPSMDVRCVMVDDIRGILVATEKGLYRVNRSTLQAEPILHSGRVAGGISMILGTPAGNLWTAGVDGLYKLGPKLEVTYEANIRNIKAIEVVNENLYLGTLNGLASYHELKGQVQWIRGLEGISILSLAYDQKDQLIVGTDNFGTFSYDVKTGTLSKFVPSAQKPSNTVCALQLDASKVLWLGTFSKGVHYQAWQQRPTFKTLTFENSTNANIRSLYIAPDGNKYIGTRDGALLCMDRNDQIKSKIQGSMFRSKILTTIYPFPGNSDLLLIGTFGGGVTLYNTKTLVCSPFLTDKTFLNGTTYKFSTDVNGHLWIGTLNGLYRYNPFNRRTTRFDLTKLMGSNEIFTLNAGDSNKVWIGTKTGVCYYSTSKKTVLQPEACKVYRYQCTSTLVDSKGCVWFCFNKGGVLKLNQRMEKSLWLTIDLALPENAPSSLVEDRRGNVWIGSSKGLFRVNDKNEIHSFGKEDGLTSSSICPESATMDKDGHLWWSNEDGLVTFLNDKSVSNNPIPSMILTTIFINGEHYDVDTLEAVTKQSKTDYTLRIKGKTKNNLEFRLAALNYLNANRNRYSYLLEGRDTSWSKPDANPSIVYNALKTGRYVLKVKATNNDGMWTTEPLKIQVILSPYFYETNWFALLMGFLFLGFLLFFTRSYVQRAKDRFYLQLEVRKKQKSFVVSRMNDQKGKEIERQLLTYMSDEKAYLNSDLRLADVAASLGYTVHEVSQVLNFQMKQPFADFVNSYRVEEIKRRIKQGDTHKFTLTATAQQCGFSAKSSFQRAFKKATQMTPSDYSKSQGKNVTPET